MFTYLEEDWFADVEVVATDLANAVALLRVVALHLHHLVVRVAHHRQNHRSLHQDVDRVARHHPTARDLPLAVRDAARLHEAGLHPQEGKGDIETGHGLLATTLRDYPGIIHVPNPRVSNRAHQRPGCDHEPHRAVAVAL